MTQNLDVSSLGTAFEIVEAIVDSNGATVMELVEEVEKPKSTVYDHVTTLHKLEYLVVRDGRYYLSFEFLRLGDISRKDMEVYQAATKELENIASNSGEHAGLTIEEHGQAVVIATDEGPEAIPFKLHNGFRMSMHTAAPGKAILAFMPRETVQEVVDRWGLKEMTVNTITDRESLFTELDEIRSQKYAQDDEERLEGIRSVAVPIIDRGDRVRGALSISGPTHRLEEELFNEMYPEMLFQSANVVEALMNYN